MARSLYGTPVYGRAEGIHISARLNSSMANGSPLTFLTVDITIDPGLYVYGEPIPEGFIPLSIDVAPLEGLKVGTPVFPPPTPHHMEGLDALFFIYEGGLSISIRRFLRACSEVTL